MILRFSFSLVFILSCFGVQVASAMDARRSGCVPPLDRAGCADIQPQGAKSYSCIPSSAKCNGDCCSSAPKLPAMVVKQELSQDSEAYRGEVDKLRKLLKAAIKSVGKSEAVKIMATELAESSDSDTQSSANSPESGDESILDRVSTKRE